jgi:D-3-phosphoglycerate dehydrogenase / 2-oxoglutarate reductase
MSDIFDGGAFVGVVNAPNLGAVARQEHLVPFVKLAEKIGSMQGQLLMRNKVGSISINLRGKDVSDTKITDVIKAAVIKGVLNELGMEQVSLVNAISLSEEIGLRVLVNMSEKTEPGSGYTNSLSVELEVGGMLNTVRTIEGSVFGRDELRITQVDGYDLDLPPGENMMLFNNYDEPGVLRRVVEKLAAASVNIAHFSLGRKAKGKLAMGAVVLDSPVPADVVSGLAANGDIKNVIAVRALVGSCMLFEQ